MTRPEGRSDLGDWISREVTAFRAEIPGLPVTPSVSAADIRERLKRYTFDTSVDVNPAVRDIADMLRRWTLHATHPRHFGLFVPGVHEAGIWADTLAALYNPQLGAWWTAPAANEIEVHTLKFLASVVGFPARAAHFTTGGSEATLTALLAAITTAFPQSVVSGVGDAAAQGVVYVSSQAHHSLQKAARTAGLGDRTVRIIDCNARHEMDVSLLRRAIDEDLRSKRRPLIIAATAGTTAAGAIDNLSEIAKIARASSAWFHVDAAWAGAVAFSATLRPLLSGIELADSLTWDAHKSLSVPMGAGMFFCRDSDVLRRLFELDASYLPRHTDQGDDLYSRSLQWSRRFIGLKVFLTLAAVGKDGMGRRIERQVEVANYLRRRLRDEGWAIANHSPLPVVCFTHPAIHGDEMVSMTAQAINERGNVWISAAALPEGPVLRACITHDDTGVVDVDALCDELKVVFRSLGSAPADEEA
jgi:aromatic-L-amino-acid/L-tryptophan decarboxylase